MKIIVSQIIRWCKSYTEMADLEIEVVKYGLELIIGTSIKYVLLLLIGYVFNKTREFAIILIVVGIFRCFAGGVHRKTSLGCFGYMLFVCVCSAGLAEVSKLLMQNIISIGSYIWIIFIVWRYAPLQSMQNPFNEIQIIKARKRGALIVILVDFLLFVISSQSIKWVYMYPLMIESVTIMLASNRRKIYEQKF